MANEKEKTENQSIFVSNNDELSTISNQFLFWSGKKDHISIDKFYECCGWFATLPTPSNGHIAATPFGHLLYRIFDHTRDLSTGISKEQFEETNRILLQGTIKERLELGFELLHDGNNMITAESLKDACLSLYNILHTFKLHESPIPVSFAESWAADVLLALDKERKGFINFHDWMREAWRNMKWMMDLGLGINQPVLLERKTSDWPLSIGSRFWDAALAIQNSWILSILKLPEDEDLPFIHQKEFSMIQEIELPKRRLIDGNFLPTRFIEFCPITFARIRKLFNISKKEILDQLSLTKILSGLIFGHLRSFSVHVSHGKSGSLFFTSENNQFFLKSISIVEKNTLFKILPQYQEYVMSNPHTLLNRIIGCFEIYGNSFIISTNIFNTYNTIHEIYDLKGSSVGRSSKEGSKVKKDLDFRETVSIAPSLSNSIKNQIHFDSNFLESLGILDYSLLLGIYKRSKNIEKKEFPNASPSKAFKANHQKYQGGVEEAKEENQSADRIYYFGIIDFLQEYDAVKKSERLVKSLWLRDSDPDISCVPPQKYGDRFRSYIDHIFP